MLTRSVSDAVNWGDQLPELSCRIGVMLRFPE